MLNQVILVGKVDHIGVYSFTLAVQRNEKNPVTDKYDVDYIRVRVPESLEKSVNDNVKEGMTIGVKASISSDSNNFMEVWAEKLTMIKEGDRI